MTFNEIDDSAFLSRFGFLFEHSPWIVAEAARLRPFNDLVAMHRAMMDIVGAAGPERQLDLLRAHPQLADKVAQATGLTAESAAEQASAGLDRLSEAEFTQFHRLNQDYSRRFGFPFIICVRLTDKAGILAAMERRLSNSAETERATALEEVGKIVWLRLNDAVTS